MGDGRIHRPLHVARIFELDEVPARAAARKIDLAIEDIAVTVARHGDPGPGTPVVGDLLTIAVGDAVETPVRGASVGAHLAGGERGLAVRADELACPGFG